MKDNHKYIHPKEFDAMVNRLEFDDILNKLMVYEEKLVRLIIQKLQHRIKELENKL